MEVLIAVIAGLVAVNAQFTPQAKPICVKNGVIAGPGGYLPHEKYCQLFYHCNLEHAFTMTCPRGSLWNTKLPGCLPPNWKEATLHFCPNWQCDVNRRYPDVCCNRFWTCENKLFTR